VGYSFALRIFSLYFPAPFGGGVIGISLAVLGKEFPNFEPFISACGWELTGIA